MKNIYIFTHSFPYSKKSELFLETEIKIASTLSNVQIFLIPLRKSKSCRKVPQNISIINKLSELSWLKKAFVFITMLFDIRFWKMFCEKEHRFKTLKNAFQAIKYYYGACLIFHFLKWQQTDIQKDAILYSYWFSFAALGFALFKENIPCPNNYTFISRAHGYDLFGLDRNILIPYRLFTLSQINHVFSVSQAGTQYLQSLYPNFSSKIETSYLGIDALSVEKQTEKTTELLCVSCSNFDSVKRVPLIFESLRQFAIHNNERKIKWIHFGDGKQLASFKKQIETLKIPNLTVELFGFIAPVELHQWYATHQVDIFINLSTSEGLPVSLMEAIGYQIPVLATDAGGTKEICNQETGYLLPVYFSQNQFEEGLQILLDKKEELKKSGYAFFQKKFNATTNYTEFYNKI